MGKGEKKNNEIWKWNRKNIPQFHLSCKFSFLAPNEKLGLFGALQVHWTWRLQKLIHWLNEKHSTREANDGISDPRLSPQGCC